ncbi:MAG: PAS domain S-box protein [Rhodospirillales bacterium]
MDMMIRTGTDEQIGNQRNARRLGRSIVAYAAIGALILGIATSGVTAYLMSNDLRRAAEDRLLVTAEVEAQAQGEFLRRIEEISWQVTGRTAARRLLERLNANEIPLSKYMEESRVILEDALRKSDELLGVIRLDIHGNVAIAVGEEPPEELWPPSVPALRDFLYRPVLSDQRLMGLVTSTPILDPANVRVGTDINLFGVEAAARLLVKPDVHLHENESVPELLLVIDTDTGRRYYRPAAIGDELIRTSALVSDGTTVEVEEIDQLTNGLDTIGSFVVAEAHSGRHDWGVVAWQHEANIYAGIYRNLFLTGGITLAIAVLGTVGMLLLVRPLTSGILGYASNVERRFQTFINSANEGIWMLDRDDYITFANRRIMEMLGRGPDEVIGKSPEEFVAPEHRMELKRQLRNIHQGEPTTIELALNGKDGNTIWTLGAGSPILDDKDQYLGAAGMFIDVTDRKRMEAELLRAQRVEAVSHLASGIAHELNNLMMPITGQSQLLIRSLGDDEKNRRRAEAILAAGRRAAELISGVLTYSQREVFPTEHEATDIAGLVSESVDQIAGSLPKRVTIRTAVDGNTGKVLCNVQQIRQAIGNVVINAIEAIGNEAGTVTVAVSGETVEEDVANGPGDSRGGRFAVIRVSDSGPGFSESAVQSAFDPFFTTKEVGEGTGLGLSIVHGIVAQHGGSVRLSNVAGNGAMVEMYIPLV